MLFRSNTTVRFAGSVLTFGAAACIAAALSNAERPAGIIAILAPSLLLGKAAAEAVVFPALAPAAALDSLALLKGPLAAATFWRRASATLAAAFMGAACAAPERSAAIVCFSAAVSLAMAAEVLERSLFFRAVVPFRMPLSPGKTP